MTTWLIGAGYMAGAYVPVLRALGVPFHVLGRSPSSASAFEAETGIQVHTEGVDAAVRAWGRPECAIVAVGVDDLAMVATSLLELGCRSILLEKPGGVSLLQLSALELRATQMNATVHVAYNRRFYASTRSLAANMVADGGPTVMHFEFNEPSHAIRDSLATASSKQAWVLSNSSHVIDLAFHLGGRPSDWAAWRQGSLDWHSSAVRFCGSGVTDRGVLFSYNSDWESPGRWGLEIATSKNRYVMRPLEQLKRATHDQPPSELVLADDLDRRFKPGLYLQTKAFLEDQTELLCSIQEQVRNAAIYSKIAGYDPGGQPGTLAK